MRASRRFHSVALATCVAALMFPAAASAALKGFDQRNLVADTPGVAEITDPNLVNPWGSRSAPPAPRGCRTTAPTSRRSTGAPLTRIPTRRSCRSWSPSPRAHRPAWCSTAAPASRSAGRRRSSCSRRRPARSPPGTRRAGPPRSSSPTCPGPSSRACDRRHPRRRAAVRDRLPQRGGRRLDDTFTPVRRPGAFTDPNLPNRFAPFGIQRVGQNIVVTYAKQDADAEDDVAGPGNGVVDIYTFDGTLKRRVASGGVLNSPWGIAKAPQGFGRGGDLLIGNFGTAASTPSTSTGAPSPASVRCWTTTGSGSRSTACGRSSSAMARSARTRRCCSPPGPTTSRTGSSAHHPLGQRAAAAGLRPAAVPPRSGISDGDRQHPGSRFATHREPSPAARSATRVGDHALPGDACPDGTRGSIRMGDRPTPPHTAGLGGGATGGGTGHGQPATVLPRRAGVMMTSATRCTSGCCRRLADAAARG